MEKPRTATADIVEKTNKPGIGTSKADVEADKLGISIIPKELSTDTSRVDVKNKPGIGTAAGTSRVDVKEVNKPGSSIAMENPGTSRANVVEADKPGKSTAAKDSSTRNDLLRSLADRQSVTK